MVGVIEHVLIEMNAEQHALAQPFAFVAMTEFQVEGLPSAAKVFAKPARTAGQGKIVVIAGCAVPLIKNVVGRSNGVDLPAVSERTVKLDAMHEFARFGQGKPLAENRVTFLADPDRTVVHR